MQFDVRFHQTDQRFNIKFNEANTLFSTVFKEFQQVTAGATERYDGDYEVTPLVTSQTLATKEKIMTDDLKIKAIPIFNVSNTAGGSTFYIATMDETPDGGVAILGKSRLGAMAL